MRFGAGWVELDVPLRAVNRGNVREAHWGPRAKANATAAEVLGNMLCTVPVPVRKTLDGPARVTLTRVAPRGLDRHDNLRQALKVYPDALSVWLRSGYMGRHDGDADLEWIYCENRDGNRYGVRVRIEAKA